MATFDNKITEIKLWDFDELQIIVTDLLFLINLNKKTDVSKKRTNNFKKKKKHE